LDPWYAAVERRLELAGAREGIAWQPDSEVRHLLEPTPNELQIMNGIRSRWPDARPMLGRYSPPLPSLELAARTGRLACRQGAIANQVVVNSAGKVSGVRWIDRQSANAEVQVDAPLVFLCASTLESTRLLLLSRPLHSPEGLGNASGALGRHLMDHMIVSGWGSGPPLAVEDKKEESRSVYLPRFDARAEAAPGAGPGFGVQLYQYPGSSTQSHFIAVTFGEMAPRPENRVTLHPTRRDAWGIPVLSIDHSYDEGDLALARRQGEAVRELAGAIGMSLGRINERPSLPGIAVHECGSARMGRSPADSVLDPHNECWEARGLYVTDGASFATQGTQNPTLTILALTARACAHALGAAPASTSNESVARSGTMEPVVS
jgi:choline dehydrogenase-like flavoprotein